MRGFFAIAVLAASLVSAQGQTQEPTGTWLSQSGDTRVRIARCGAAYCGTIVAVQGNLKDTNNPDAGKRDRSLVGVQMITDIQPTGNGAYTGQLYNFTDGRTYSGKMQLRGANALELSGCVLGGIICRAQTWSKVN